MTSPILAGTNFKDETLHLISPSANVAQFVSFGPDLKKRFDLIRTLENIPKSEPDRWIDALLKSSSEGKVNVRSFKPSLSKATPFILGLSTIAEAAACVSRLAGDGLFTIVNEAIDMGNGGTGGVVVGNVIEFAPCDTPRAVEAPGVASLARAAGTRLLESVYGQRLPLNYEHTLRIEFTVHPTRCGYRNEHTIIWEVDRVNRGISPGIPSWPNRFSRFIGDKAFGLLVCAAFGLPVPKTRVISRVVAPFEFGESSGTGETWLRTCSPEPVPGRFTTVKRWIDPFMLLQSEDPSGELVSSVLAQEGVNPEYSGSLVSDAEGEIIVEGVKGTGTAFMLARQAPDQLPDDVVASVRKLYGGVSAVLGPASIEWVYDGQRTWLIQAHAGATASRGKVILHGEVDEYRIFEVRDGLEALRKLASEIDHSKTGIVVAGDVGVTSHVGDVLRQAGVVSYIDPTAQSR